jgi:hypothetical protein
MATREQILAKYARYNASRKGQARRKKYEEAHPERKERWSPIMFATARDRRVLLWREIRSR